MILRLICIAVFSCIFSFSASADIKDDIRTISKEKSKLSRQVSGLFRKLQIKNKELDVLNEKALEASKAFIQARKAHPDLKAPYKASDAARSRMVKASVDGDKDAAKAAREDFTEARMELEKVSRAIPEFTELQNKAIEANKAVQAKKKELLASTPEGKVLFDKVEVLEAKIAELRKLL